MTIAGRTVVIAAAIVTVAIIRVNIVATLACITVIYVIKTATGWWIAATVGRWRAAIAGVVCVRVKRGVGWGGWEDGVLGTGLEAWSWARLEHLIRVTMESAGKWCNDIVYLRWIFNFWFCYAATREPERERKSIKCVWLVKSSQGDEDVKNIYICLR